MKKLLLLSLCAFALPARSLPSPAAASYAWGAQLTVAGYDAAKPALTNFPVLVRIAENSPNGFSYAQVQMPGGADLCFIDMAGNGLPFEIDTWDPNGTSLVWVTLPTMGRGTEFAMCWGGATSGKTVCPDNPFASYKGVWHMNQTNVADASGSGNDGTASGAVALTNGVVGTGLSYPDTDAFVSCGSSQAESELKGGYTVEGWVNLANTSGQKALFGKSGFISYRMEGTAVKITTPAVSDYDNVDNFITDANNWHHFALSFKPNTTSGAKHYVDGVLKAQQNTGGLNNKTGSIEMWLARNQWGSSQGFTGLIDEYRLAPRLESADWIAATYATQSDPAFLTAGAATPYEATPTPQVGVAVSDVQYTNATLTVSIGSLGQNDTMTADASWAEATLLVATDSSFASPLFAIPLARTNEAPVSIPVAVQPLATNATYYAMVLATNEFGVAGESGAASFATRTPGAAAGLATFLATGFTSLSVSGRVADFGVGSSSASVRLEASETDDFASFVAAESLAATLGADADFTVAGLRPDTAYHLRLRVANEWGIETFLPVAGTHATLDIPLVATGLGYTFSPDNATVDFTFGVSGTFGEGPFTAELTYDGKSAGTRSFSGPGLLSWTGVNASSSARTATVTVTAVAGGTTYIRSWSATVAPGARAYAVSSLADLATLALFVGDSVTLPALRRPDDHYLPLDVRSFELDADGRTLVAIEPGFSAVCAMEWDAAADAYVRNPAMGLAICIPEAGGRVFVADAGGADMSWSETAKWRCVSDSSVTGVYPDGAGDVAMVPMSSNKVFTVDVDATVGSLYAGWDASAPPMGGVRVAGNGTSTLTFRTGTKKPTPGLVRVTGLGRRDVDASTPSFTFGSSGSGSRLAIAIPDGLDFDGGKCPDETDTTLRGTHNRLKFRNGYGKPVEVPAGKTFRVFNFDHAGVAGSDSQMGQCSSFVWASGFPFTGEGTVVYDTAAVGYFDSTFKDFAGTLVVRQRERYAGVGVDSRGGGFWLKANTGYEARNATFVVEGESGYHSNDWFPTTARQVLGLATYGATHGWGNWGPGDNSFGGRALVMAGGVLMHRSQGTDAWSKNGIFSTPNRSDALVVSNGYSFIDQKTYRLNAPYPTNRTEFASLRHEGRGTICVMTTDTWNDAGEYSPSHCIVRNAAALAIGGGGADGSRTESIVPWIVAPQQSFNRIYFPYFGTRDGETDCLVLSTQPSSKALAEASNPVENVFVGGASVALSQDATVNALYVNDNWSKGTALGAGRTLTVTSGGLVLEGSRSAIGKESEFLDGTAGTLRLPNEGYLYSTRQSSSEPNELWASIVAPKGLAISFPGCLRLGGDQSGVDEELAINGCDVTFGSSTTGCTIDVPVRLESGAAKLRIAKAGSFCGQKLYLDDHAGAGPKFIPAAGSTERVHKLYVNGASMPRGYYGSSESGVEALGDRAFPAFVDDEHFSGTGCIKVMTDDLLRPTLLILH